MSQLEDLKARKGAVRIADVPPIVLEALNQGTIPTVNLVESLVIDHAVLAASTLPSQYIEVAVKAVRELPKQTSLLCIKAVGKALQEEASKRNDKELLSYLIQHESDNVRCWACTFIGYASGAIEEKLNLIFPLATDCHFGVREISWIAVRDQLIEEFDAALPIFKTWVISENEYQRRFAIESIRPKGVWCKQFKRIQEHPELALSLLDPLQKEPSKYVQDSVANWLNDASKHKPLFVKDLCRHWSQRNPTSKATAYIIKRALRSIK